MTTMTGVKDAKYLVHFLGGKIGIREGENKFGVYHLTAIFAGKVVQVTDHAGDTHFFNWDECENPYMFLTNSTAEWSIR